MPQTGWTAAHTERAKQIWDTYQRTHDVSSRIGQAVGIDPESGSVWFGESDVDIVLERRAAGETAPLYFLRVGRDYYGRKGGAR